MEYATPLILNIESSQSKRAVIEKVKESHLKRQAVMLVPIDDGSMNTAFFVADVFRRNGHFVQSVSQPQELNIPYNLALYICFMSNTVLEKQITRDDTLESLQNEASVTGSYKLVRACGTACSTAWTYSQWLIGTGEWRQMGELNLNAIPVKIDGKTIFKTTIQINLQKVNAWGV